jgi:hypothetical protein
MARPPHTPLAGSARAAARAIAVWLVVMGASAAGLAGLDRVPGWLSDTPRGARTFRSIEEAERVLGARAWLPAYYPDELAWPPRRVEASTATPPTLVLRIAARADGRDRLVLAQSISGSTPPPAALLPAGEVMDRNDVQFEHARARLVRVLLGPQEWHDLSWNQGGRLITLRYSGPVWQLLLIGRSLESR